MRERKDNTANIAIMLTHQCQLKCRYCGISRKQHDMSLPIVKKTIDLLFTSSSDDLELQFFGGEPLLRYDLVKEAIEYAKQKEKETAKKVSFLLTTNGLLLDKEKIRYLKKRGTKFLLSADGGEKTHIKNRPMGRGSMRHSYQAIVLAIKLLNREKTEYFVNMVVGPKNIDLMVKNFFFLSKSGARKIRISYELGVFWGWQDAGSYYLNIFEIARRLYMNNSEGTLMNFGISDDEPYLFSPALTVDSDGVIYIGCTVPLEKKFPELKKISRVGSLDRISFVRKIERSRGEIFVTADRVFEKDKEKKAVVNSNITMGTASAGFFSEILISSKQ
jgi:sulfatase maturation enzyme AslB (radical SAM superfamily)